jgi:hypothetical protein
MPPVSLQNPGIAQAEYCPDRRLQLALRVRGRAFRRHPGEPPGAWRKRELLRAVARPGMILNPAGTRPTSPLDPGPVG